MDAGDCTCQKDRNDIPVVFISTKQGAGIFMAAFAGGRRESSVNL